MIKKLLICAFILTILSCSSYAQTPQRKLMRGTVNLMTGWVEVPKNIYDVSIENGIRSGLTKGTASGVALAIVRTGCGVYEMATFPFPVPDNYEPIMYPEYVLSNTVNLKNNIDIK